MKNKLRSNAIFLIFDDLKECKNENLTLNAMFTNARVNNLYFNATNANLMESSEKIKSRVERTHIFKILLYKVEFTKMKH
jgi:hypothetical protein